MFWLRDKTVLITGGTGSFGQRCAQVLLEQASLKRLILLSRDEQKHVTLRRTLFPPDQYPRVRYFVGDVRDAGRLRTAFRDVDYVIHAAAMKHVDMAEYNPQECIATNIDGAQNVIQASLDCGVRKVVALSTDKAASPINLYGATKLCSDKLFVASNSLAGQDGTRFSVVRYGNVLNSNGSVVPFFLNQRKKGFLPITDAGMTRFIITLEQGVWFVLDAMQKMAGGEVFIPKIPSVTISDIAEAVAPECPTRVVGIRPGEKLHECMIPADEARSAVEFDDHYVIKPAQRSWDGDTPWYESSGKPCAEGFSYTSDNNDRWLTPAQLREMVRGEYPDALESDPDTPRLESDPDTPRPPTRKTADRMRIGEEMADGESANAVLPYSRQSVTEQDVQSVARVLRGPWLTTGPEVDEFESAVARLSEARHAVAFCNGTAALHAALDACGVGQGDEVIVPALTFVATANAAVYCGGRPVFADVSPRTLLLEPEQIESLITDRTRVLVTVDYAGQTCPYDRIQRIADRHGLRIVADACHSLGGRYADQPVAHWADAACYSFHPVKPITCGEGGMVVTGDGALAARMREFRNHGIDTDHRDRATAGTVHYDMHSRGFNYRLSDIHAALGRSQIQRWSVRDRRRARIADWYRKRLAHIPHVTVMGTDPQATHGYHLFVVRWNGRLAGCDRDAAIRELRNSGIQANVHYKPVYQHSWYRNRTAANHGSRCPVAEQAYQEIMSLPMYPELQERDVERICGVLNRLGTRAARSISPVA